VLLINIPMPELRLPRLLGRAVICAFATTVTISILSKLQTRHAAAGPNATSHIVWGKPAFRVDEPDLRHTLVGVLLNFGAMLSWSTVYELLPEPRSMSGNLFKASGVTVLSYLTDYSLVPERVTPGFEQRLSPVALALVYLALGAGFLAAAPRHDPSAGPKLAGASV
jgi:hypothetical protein